MDYKPPEPADLANVRALNATFLDACRHPEHGRAVGVPPPGLQAAWGDPRALDRLHRCPFMLLSIAENDAGRWARLFDRAGGSKPDLVDAMGPTLGAPPVLLAAAGFLWQLAHRRPYAARVISGASLAWCERLSGCTLVDVFRFVTAEPDLLGYRNADNAAFWQRLLLSATCSEISVRRAARTAALQMLLTGIPAGAYRPMAAAACSMPAPASRVAERPSVSKPGTRGYNTPPDDGAPNKKPDKNLRQR